MRDKDAVQASVIIAEVAALYKAQGRTLLEGLNALNEEHGYYLEDLESVTLKGKTGMAKIKETMTYFRSESFMNEFEKPLAVVEDYELGHAVDVLTGAKQPLDLPVADVLKFKLMDGSWFAIRPSGTEPKIKFYFGVKAKTKIESDNLLVALKHSVMSVVNKVTATEE